MRTRCILHQTGKPLLGCADPFFAELIRAVRFSAEPAPVRADRVVFGLIFPVGVMFRQESQEHAYGLGLARAEQREPLDLVLRPRLVRCRVRRVDVQESRLWTNPGHAVFIGLVVLVGAVPRSERQECRTDTLSGRGRDMDILEVAEFFVGNVLPADFRVSFARATSCAHARPRHRPWRGPGVDRYPSVQPDAHRMPCIRSRRRTADRMDSRRGSLISS